MPALSFALSIGLVLNGVSRPFFGWVSDHIGRENTMFIAFLLEGIGIFALGLFAHNPVLFVLLSGLVFFAWGEIFALFPATCTDIYGRKFATANYGMLYTAKGVAALLVPLANVLDNGNRQLDRRIRGGIGAQYPRSDTGLVRIEARADAGDGEGKINAIAIGPYRVSVAKRKIARKFGSLRFSPRRILLLTCMCDLLHTLT